MVAHFAKAITVPIFCLGESLSCYHQQSATDNLQTIVNCRASSIMGTKIHTVYSVFAGRIENAYFKRSRLHQYRVYPVFI